MTRQTDNTKQRVLTVAELVWVSLEEHGLNCESCNPRIPEICSHTREGIVEMLHSRTARRAQSRTELPNTTELDVGSRTCGDGLGDNDPALHMPCWAFPERQR